MKKQQQQHKKKKTKIALTTTLSHTDWRGDENARRVEGRGG